MAVTSTVYRKDGADAAEPSIVSPSATISNPLIIPSMASSLSALLALEDTVIGQLIA
jgi:hypothetical protein